MNQGFDLQREVLQRGFQPAVLRQYGRHRSCSACLPRKPEERTHCSLPCARAGVEGQRRDARLTEIAGTVGATAARRARRNTGSNSAITSRRSAQCLENGVILDALEIAATWDAIRASIHQRSAALREVPGLLTASSLHSRTCTE